MVGCCGISLIRLKMKQVAKKMRLCGLERKLVSFSREDGQSTIECWTPSEVSSDKPCLLLIHGFGLNSLLEWEFQLRDFSRDFNLFIPNLLFFGESTTTSTKRSEVFQAECLKNMLEELNVTKVDVIGTSYGGMVAFWMAHLFPAFVGKLVLANSAVNAEANDTADLLTRYGGVSSPAELLMPATPAALRKSMEFVLQKKQTFLPNFILWDMIQEVFCYNRDLRTELLRELIIGSKAHQASSLPTLSKEVLIVWGANDQIFKVELAHQLKKHLGSSVNLVVIPGTAHAPHSEQPKAFNTPVLAFLK